MEEEKYLRTCTDCGNQFVSSSKMARVCPNCKRSHKQILTERFNANHKKPQTKRRVPSSDAVPLGEAVRLIDRYNAKKGTNYTYGTCPYSPERLKRMMKK